VTESEKDIFQNNTGTYRTLYKFKNHTMVYARIKIRSVLSADSAYDFLNIPYAKSSHNKFKYVVSGTD
jgi:hypothetical protein